jgi:hypothetical protein
MENSAFAGELQPTPQRTFKLQSALLFGNVPQPWRQGLPELPSINPIPSMICDDESRFLHWISRNRVQGDGCIVDLGPLAGGSTHALCSGVALNPRAAGRTRVHSYDLWRFHPDWQSLFPGQKLRRGASVHPLFMKNLQGFRDTVVSHAGDILKYRWGGEPIEILFIDAAKSPELWTHILREFLPHCVPGRTLIVQQDWVCAQCPWIHITTARLSEYLVPVDSPLGATVAFLLRRPIPASLLEERDFADPAATTLGRLDQAAALTLGWYGLCVQLAKAHYLVMRGRPKEALAVVDQVLAHPDYTSSVKPDLDLVLASVSRGKQWLRALVRPAAGWYFRNIARER